MQAGAVIKWQCVNAKKDEKRYDLLMDLDDDTKQYYCLTEYNEHWQDDCVILPKLATSDITHDKR